MSNVRASDLIKLNNDSCKDCHKCCTGMGKSIILTPYDIYLLYENMGLNFSDLLEGPLELTTKEGLILPCIKMQEATNACGFLNKDGRCSIHDFRPDVCRLFPVAREYSERGISYFYMEEVCPKKPNVKVKVEKWLGYSNPKQYEKYLKSWHEFSKEVRLQILNLLDEKEDDKAQNLSLWFLNEFFVKPYESEDFFAEYQSRIDALKV